MLRTRLLTTLALGALLAALSAPAHAGGEGAKPRPKVKPATPHEVYLELSGVT